MVKAIKLFTTPGRLNPLRVVLDKPLKPSNFLCGERSEKIRARFDFHLSTWVLSKNSKTSGKGENLVQMFFTTFIKNTQNSQCHGQK